MRSTVGAILDSKPIGGRQLLLVALILAALVIDGLDNHILGLVGPLILEEWSITKAAFGPALSAAFIGMVIGAGVGGWLGDRYGRKVVLCGATLLFGVTTVATSMVDGVGMLIALRLIGGLGFGAANPNGMALATEWLPRRARSKVVSLLAAGTPFGGMIGAGALLYLLPLYGWRGCFVICGIFTLVLAGAILFSLPESPSYLLRRNRGERARRSVDAMVSLPPNQELVAGEEEARSKTRATIFVAPYKRVNIGAWLGLFAITALAYGVTTWGPVFLTMAGLSLETAITAGFAFNLCSLGVMIAAGLIIDRFGSRAVILGSCALAMFFVVLLAVTLQLAHGQPSTTVNFLTFGAVGGIGGVAGLIIGTFYSTLTYAYPAACRASGLGFGHVLGRAGGIASSLIGGILLGVDGNNLLPFFVALGLTVIATVFGAFILDRHIPAGESGSRAEEAEERRVAAELG